MSKSTPWLVTSDKLLDTQDAFVVPNIEKATLENKFYRKVEFTTLQFQLVYMTLLVGEDIPKETHEDVTQFFRIEKGQGQFVVNGRTIDLQADGVIVVPAGTEHYVKNSSDSEPLQMYVIYAPREHPATRRDERQPPEDAENSE